MPSCKIENVASEPSRGYQQTRADDVYDTYGESEPKRKGKMPNTN